MAGVVNSVKKYCYIPTGNQVWLDAAIELYQKGIAEPVLWIGDDRHYLKAREFFGSAVIQKQDFVFYPERIKNIEYAGENIDFFLSDNYLRAKDRCLKMMDRLDMYGTFSRLDREAIFDKLTMWALKQMEQSKPEAMVVSETPHSHTYYLIYEICLYLDLEIVKFNTWPTVPLLFLQDMRTDKRFRKKIDINSNISQIIESEVLSHIGSLGGNNQNYELPYMRAQRLQLKWKNRIASFFKLGILSWSKEQWFQARMNFGRHYYPVNPYKMGIFGRYKIKRLRRKNLLDALKEQQQIVDTRRRYVYFALHFEPERTTNPDGGEFHDQILAISRLRAMVPTDVDIIVKEHPTQFYMAERGARGRSPIFYDCVTSMSGVQMANINQSSLELIENSVFVATITGSAAFESAAMGKKALIFGDTWFNGCPNVIRWEAHITFDDMVIGEILCTNKIIDFLLTEKRLYGVPGCLNPSAQRRAAHYLNDSFFKSELKGVVHLLERFFSEL